MCGGCLDRGAWRGWLRRTRRAVLLSAPTSSCLSSPSLSCVARSSTRTAFLCSARARPAQWAIIDACKGAPKTTSGSCRWLDRVARARAGQGLATPAEKGWLRWRVCDPRLGVSIDTIFPPNLPSHVNRLRCAHPPILGVCTLVERVPPLLVLEPQLHRPSSRGAVRSAMRLSQQIYLDLI